MIELRAKAEAFREESIYKPWPSEIVGVKGESPEITTFRLSVEGCGRNGEPFTFKPGNFVLASVLGHGEAPFAIASNPSQKKWIEISVRRLGRLTQALHELTVGDRVGLRGPYGNHFLREDMPGKNLIFIAGGIGMAPLRSLLLHVLNERGHYGEISILYGARTVENIPYKEEFKQWRRIEGVNQVLTVDPGGETLNWRGRVGYVPDILSELDPSPENCLAYTCGPQIVIKLSARILVERGFRDRDITSTLENKMKCGVGKCGRCNIGHIHVCKHGPVFTYQEISRMPPSDY